MDPSRLEPKNQTDRKRMPRSSIYLLNYCDNIFKYLNYYIKFTKKSDNLTKRYDILKKRYEKDISVKE